MSKDARRPPLRWVLSIVLTVGLLAALLTQVELVKVADTLLNLEPLWVAIGFGFYVALQLIRTLRYRLLAPEASGRLLVGVHFVSVLLLRIMPLRTGEVGFAWLMRRGGAGGIAKNLVGILIVRVLDVASVLGVFAVALVLGGDLYGAGAPPLGVALLVGGGALLAPFVARFALNGLATVSRKLLALKALARSRRFTQTQTAFEDAVTWANELPRRTMMSVTGLTAIQWVVNFTMLGVALKAMHVSATVPQIAIGGTGSIAFGFLPLAAVGSFGTAETGWALGFASVGIELETAIATAFGFSVLSFLYAMATAAVGWVLLPRPSAAPASDSVEAPGESAAAPVPEQAHPNPDGDER